MIVGVGGQGSLLASKLLGHFDSAILTINEQILHGKYLFIFPEIVSPVVLFGRCALAVIQ